MRISVFLRAVACVALVSVLAACSAVGVQPTTGTPHSGTVQRFDDPQTPNK